MKRSFLVMDNVVGPPCPRCQQSTEVRQHRALSEKVLRQPFYFSRWYYCINAECKTTLIMPGEFKVYRETRD